jgi:hypothetical protein
MTSFNFSILKKLFTANALSKKLQTIFLPEHSQQGFQMSRKIALLRKSLLTVSEINQIQKKILFSYVLSCN